METKKSLSIKELKKKNHGFTNKVVSDIREALEMDFTRDEACHHADISPDTFYRWLKESEEFKGAVEGWESMILRNAKKNLNKKVALEGKEGGAFYSLEVLKRRQKERYSEQIDQDIKQEVKGAFEIIIGRETKKDPDSD